MIRFYTHQQAQKEYKVPKSTKKTKQTLWPLFMDGVQLPQG